MAMASECDDQLHFLLIPLMSQSHIIPLTDFAVFLARQGPVVSIITTPLNATKYKPIIDRATKSGLKIHLIPVKFPGEQFGLPEGCENMDALPSLDLAGCFFDACSLLQGPIETLARKMLPKPSCIVSTNALPWTQPLAQRLNIPRYIFHTISCFTLLCSEILGRTNLDDLVDSYSETFYLPGMPYKIGFTKSQLPEGTRKGSGDLSTILDSIKEVEKSARGVLVNSFKELDPTYENGVHKENFWCVGPVSLSNDKTAIDDDDDEHYCLKWLDKMGPTSVIYACFGSLCRLTAAQLKEIGSGLERSGRPFIWVIRDLDYSPEIDRWLKDGRFQDRVGGLGLVVRGWARQVQILAHPAIGAFLTHGGWNSTLEGICAGIPMITWPMFAEQFYNEKYVVEVQKIAVAVGAKEAAVLVRGEQIAAAIGRVMAAGEEGDRMRERARRLSEMAKNAVEEGGSSYVNLRLLIQDVWLQQQNAVKL